MTQITVGACEIFEKGTGKKRIKLRGIISTEHRDRQGEVIKQDGLDFQPFLDYGWFNDNHSGKTHDVLGYPERVFRTTIKDTDGRSIEATAVEGYLLPTKRGLSLLDVSKNLKGNGSRSLGFSVEGDVVERSADDDSIIVRATIKNVAVTHMPVNPNTTLEALAKSLSKGMDSSSIAPLMPESLEGEVKVYLTPNPIVSASKIAQLYKRIGDEKMKKEDYLSMFKMMPDAERDAMMSAYSTYKSDEGEEILDNPPQLDQSEEDQLAKMQEESDRELGLAKAMPQTAVVEPEEDETEDQDEVVDVVEEDSLTKGLISIEKSVAKELEDSDLSHYLSDDTDINSATEIDASGFLKSLVDGNGSALEEISKSLNGFGQQQRATNLTVLALGRLVQTLSSEVTSLSKSMTRPVAPKGAVSTPQAQAIAKSFSAEGGGASNLNKAQILENLQSKLMKNLDNTNLSTQIADAVIRYESTGSISAEMLAIAQQN